MVLLVFIELNIKIRLQDKCEKDDEQLIRCKSVIYLQ